MMDKIWEDYMLDFGQLISVSGCLGAVVAFLYMAGQAFVEFEAWAVYGLLGSAIGFFYSWAMLVVFCRVQHLMNGDE